MKSTWMLFCLLLAGVAHAGILIDATRVIYPAGKREVTLALTSKAADPRLIQTWIDSGEEDTPPEAISAPFIIIPPIFRLNPNQGQSLRIIHTGGALPQDRESVFWLNVLEIPPKPDARSDHIQLTVRSRLKIFYRPAGLPGSPNEAVKQLRWRRVNNALECENPSAFNVSFNHVGLKSADASGSDRQSGMCPARGKRTFVLPVTPVSNRVFFTTIDDHGGLSHHEANLSR